LLTSGTVKKGKREASQMTWGSNSREKGGLFAGVYLGEKNGY